MKEQDIQRSILDFLKWKKIFCWKNNTAGIYKKATGHYIPSGAVGSADIFAISKGTFYAIEVKTTTGKQSEKQKEFQENVEKAGGIYILAKSIEDLGMVFE